MWSNGIAPISRDGLTLHGDELPNARVWAWARDPSAREDDDALRCVLER